MGVGSAKTLAKLANPTAKKIDALGGVCVWEALPAERRDALLEWVQAAHGEGSLGLGYAGLAQPAHWEM